MNKKEFIKHRMLGLMLKNGYLGVSVSDLQQDTNIARGLIYHYYSGLDELKKEIINDSLEKWTLTADNELRKLTILDFTTKLVAHYQSVAEEINILSFKVLLLEACRHSTELNDIITTHLATHYSLWRSVVLNSFAKGQLKTGLNLESITRHLNYIEEGYFFTSSLKESNHDLIYNLDKRIREFYEIIER